MAYVLGKSIFPRCFTKRANDSACYISVPFIFRPLGGLFFGHLGDKYGRQKFWPLLSLLCPSVPLVLALFHLMKQSVYGHLFFTHRKIVQGFSIGGEYSGAAIL